MKFTEDKPEKAFSELLAQEGYPHCLGNALKVGLILLLDKHGYRGS